MPHERGLERGAGGRRCRRGGLFGTPRRGAVRGLMEVDELNRWIRYHGEIAYALTMERTALESALIPVSAYILVACVECYRRYPEMIEEIAAAAAPEELGRAGHRFATQIDNVHLWALPNFAMIGRKVLATAGLVDWEEDRRRMAIVFDFWDR